MRKQGMIAFILAILLVTGLTACGGGGAKAQTDIRTTTTGQELTDLKKALDAGAITQEEYEAQREKILKRK